MEHRDFYNRLSESVKEDLNYLKSIPIQEWQTKLELLLSESSNPERVIVAFTQFLKNVPAPIETYIAKYLETPKYLRFFERIFSQVLFLPIPLLNIQTMLMRFYYHLIFHVHSLKMNGYFI